MRTRIGLTVAAAALVCVWILPSAAGGSHNSGIKQYDEEVPTVGGDRSPGSGATSDDSTAGGDTGSAGGVPLHGSEQATGGSSSDGDDGADRKKEGSKGGSGSGDGEGELADLHGGTRSASLAGSGGGGGPGLLLALVLGLTAAGAIGYGASRRLRARSQR